MVFGLSFILALKQAGMNQAMINRQFELTGELYMYLQRSAAAYQEYLQGGKTFRLAKILRVYNEKIRELILQRGFVLPESLQKDGLELVSHYDTWMQKWDELKTQINPAPDDVFVFSNSATFPKEAARNLEDAYKRLKQQLTGAG